MSIEDDLRRILTEARTTHTALPDCARVALATAKRHLIDAEQSGNPARVTWALGLVDRAEAYLMRVEEADAKFGGTQ